MMQELIIYNKKEVIIQADDKCYQDTKENFLVDYGKAIEYEAIDYNRETKGCWLDEKPFQKYPNEVCEDILDSIDELLANKGKREYVESKPPTAEELQQYFEDGIEAWMNTVVAERDYDSIDTCIARYTDSPNPKYAQEAKAVKDWNTFVWDKCWDIIKEVKEGKRAIPTLEEVIAELPVLVW